MAIDFSSAFEFTNMLTFWRGILYNLKYFFYFGGGESNILILYFGQLTVRKRLHFVAV